MLNPAAYKDALRGLLQSKGKPVQFTDPARWRKPDVPETSAYGDWFDYEATIHASTPADNYGGEGCWWEIAPGAEVTEETYTEWGGTFGTDDHTIGINVTPVSCACGKYTNMTLRYEKPLSVTLLELLGEPVSLITL